MTRNIPVIPGDVLSEALACLQVDGITLSRTITRGERATSLGDIIPGAMMHVVESGDVELRAPTGEVRLLTPGTIALTPVARGHALGIPGAVNTLPFASLRKEHDNGFKTIHLGEDGEERARVFTAYFTFGFESINPIIELLLGNMVVPPDEITPDLEGIVGMLMNEMRCRRAGVKLMSARLVEMLFVGLLRVRIERDEELRPGLLRGLQDERLARVLGAISVQPERDWTIEALGRSAGLSRSRLTSLFKERVGMTPYDYVTHWRILKAQRMMLDADDGLSVIADRVGYGSNVALSRAFKRVTGRSPGAWRAHERARRQHILSMHGETTG